MLDIRPIHPDDTPAVIDLWHRCGLVRPTNDPWKDILRKSQVRPELFLVGYLEEALVASVMAGYEGHRGWINYLAVHPEHQRKGLGRVMMEAAEDLLRVAGAPKINLQVRSPNASALAFYRAIGYVQDDVVSFGKRLERDN